MVAVPTPFAVTTPVLETDATLELLLLHKICLLVAVDGNTVAVKVVVSPNKTFFDVGNDTLVGATTDVAVNTHCWLAALQYSTCTTLAPLAVLPRRGRRRGRGIILLPSHWRFAD